ncbi:hypothetical protein KRX54_00035 [Actinomycetaceae bacterium TAE3-ERU4]|nr:hypothetical protein [Actinomycetaceae bacterium TAE3-ERU4]
MNENVKVCKTPVESTPFHRLLAGLAGGFAGGVVFGMMMWQMGMFSMIAMMMGSDSALVGAGIHLMISLMFGVIGGFLLPYMPSCPSRGLLFVLLFGIALWVAGPLVGMPLLMGGKLFTITNATMMSLMGHIIYAAVTLYVGRAVLKSLS